MSRRREAAPVPDTIANPDWSGLLEAALTQEGSVGNTYSRLYPYSMGNIAFLMYQGVTPQPVATYARWQEVGRQVKRGSTAYYILRPITVKLKDELDEQGQPKTITKFKAVKSVFPISMTDGEPLPEVELPEWSKTRALTELDITEEPFATYDGNTQGYSYDRTVAINPVARFPAKTLMHEMGHVVLGHTTEGMQEYTEHRGVKEAEAEGTAHLATAEVGLMTPEAAEVSRGYLQTWLGQSALTGANVRRIFKATDTIVKAGRPPLTAVDKSTTKKVLKKSA